MKKTIYTLLATSVVYGNDLSMEQIRIMVQKIHDPRDGISIEKLKDTKEPFVRVENENNTTTYVVPVEEEDTKLTLNAILNESAYINGQWKRVDENVSGYTLKYIGRKGVVLKKDTQIKKLFLSKKKLDFITINERKQ